MDRKEFIVSSGAFAAFGGCATTPKVVGDDCEIVQREIDGVRAADFIAYLRDFDPSMLRKFPSLNRLEDAFDRVLREVRETKLMGTVPIGLVCRQ